MIRDLLADTLAGLIFLSILGFVAIAVGPTLTAVLAGAGAIGFLLRRIPRDRPRAPLNSFPRPIGRVRRIDSKS